MNDGLQQQWRRWAEAGTKLGPAPDDAVYAEWCAEGDWLLDQNGHGQHAGWTFDHGTGVMLCDCGEDPANASRLAAASSS